MVSALDVAAYILERRGPMIAMKLQKLVYYSQAWSLVWDEGPLFKEKIEAWASGPVVRQLYNWHRGSYQVRKISSGDAHKLNETQRETVDAVLQFYGDKPSQWLSDLTHIEGPWRQARKGIPEMARSDRQISLASMAEYYTSLEASQDV